jgi:acyl-coenzyme A thioesterase PaaI-like protein
MLVAPPSVTRHLEVKYRRAVTAEAGHIRVVARLLEKKKRRLVLEAHVLDSDQQVLASGRATNWIIDSLDR